MHRANLCLISIVIFCMICPNTAMSSSTNEVITGSNDAPENIPNPSEEHNINPISIDPCSINDCLLNTSISNYYEIKGNFTNSDDKDVFWIKSNSINKLITYNLCINSTSVPISITSHIRNTENTSIISADLENNLVSEIPTNNLICKNYPVINENTEEFWIKINSLSTSGNYSIIFNSQQIETNGQELNGNLTHIEYTNKGISGNKSLGHTTLSVLNHSISEGQLWNLELLSNQPHKITSLCNYKNETQKICFEINSSSPQEFYKTNFIYYAPKEVKSIEIVVEITSWLGSWNVKNSLSKSGDPFMGDAEDAPGNLTDLQCGQKCQEFEANTGLTYSGSMPTSIFDQADVWKINILGNESETFLVEIQLQCDPNSVVLEFHSTDINDNINLTYIVPNDSNWNSLQVEVSPGTHYIRLINIKLGNSFDWEYGDLNKPVTNYELKLKWIQNETDTNFIFEVNEELIFWDNILLWFLGLCMISPMIWVLFNIRKDRAKMQLLLHDKKRLGRLRKLNSQSEINEVKADLNLFIRSITNMDWEILLDNWGVPDLNYVTDSISINSWKLDAAIANNGGIPLLIIIETHIKDWEIAGLKFESSNNLEWNIVSLLPNLLFRNHEVFLDTIKVGNKVTLEVELKGDGKDVQIHISGMSEGKPVAVKTTTSIELLEEE